MDYVNCYDCNGGGIDSESWDGRCFACDGSGQKAVEDRDLDDCDSSDYAADESM